MDIHSIISPYNPWLTEGLDGFAQIPDFHRPIFDELIQGIADYPQILSITGPRRIGKSTLLYQIIRHLIRSGKPAESCIYYSLDDPALFRPGVDPHQVMELLLEKIAKDARATGENAYLFLDEIQRLERWELYLKKYYDLHYPVKFIVSGSASAPIFKKSRESLLGRVKDYHLRPFSFREFLLYRLKDQGSLVSEITSISAQGEKAIGLFTDDPRHLGITEVPIQPISDNLWFAAESLFKQYIRDGGFPEVWNLSTWDKKTDYLYENQVKKVIYEDLLLAAEFRKPEQLKRFYISLLEKPGREVNFSQIAEEVGVQKAQVEKYLPLLEMTDLLSHIDKFRKSPLRVRRSHVKFYMVDLALRNAVLRITQDQLDDPTTLGTYAENLVYTTIRKWKGTVAIDYYRDHDGEVDFIVHLGSKKFLPIEVKHKDRIDSGDLSPINRFSRKYNSLRGLLVTKKKDDFGNREDIFFLPLLHFLILLDR